MTDVLLVNPPMWSPNEHRAFDALCPPLGLGYLAACLLREGFTVRILDLNLSMDPYRDLTAACAEASPRLVGVTTLTQNYAMALRVARAAKAIRPNTFLAMGGPHVSYLWEEVLLNEPAVDAVGMFEGEQTIVELAQFLTANDRELDAIAGLGIRLDGKAVKTPRRKAERDLDRLPLPARELLPMAEYRRPGTIMTSRGCPEKCIFCIASTYEGAYRMRGAESVLDELSILRHTYGIREIYFLDNVFTVDPQRVRDICGQIVERELDIRFHCVSRANLLTLELALWLKRAGCVRVEIGVESGSQDLIDAYKKRISLEHVHRAADAALDAGLQPMFTFQIGSPFETEETLRATHELAKRLRARGAITFFSAMTPYPGTTLARHAEQLGVHIHARDWNEYRTSNPVYDGRHLDRNRFRRALYREVAEGYKPGSMPYLSAPITP
jgi:radical SAM superfamily enzyme YgiQ (UPF0313 family)